MSRVKSSDIPHYELLCLISNKYSETEAEPIRANINKLISDHEGTITFEENWGKRKLAYPIEGFRHGYYYLVEFDIAGPKLNELNNRLRLSNDIVRHQIIKKHRKTAVEIAEDARIAEKIATRRKTEEAAIADKKASKETKDEDDKRTDLKDFDQELDKIIDVSNLL